MATFELYRRSTIGMCLTETLDEMDAMFKSEDRQENVSQVKIVACDSKLLTQMPRNKGQLSSAGAYNSGTDQDSAQDDSRPEISCFHMYTNDETWPFRTQNSLQCMWTLLGCQGAYQSPQNDINASPTHSGELGSDADANSSNYEPATVEEHSALVSLANGDNSNMLGNH
ncbi:hypothetical protein Bca101_096618 [Brassica carinata]